MKKFLFSFFAIASFAVADDVEIYQGAASGATPNILLVMDTSRSMSRYERDNLGEYDPEITYEKPLNGYDPEGIYLSLRSQGTGFSDTEVAEIRRKRIHPDSIACQDIQDRLDETGVYASGIYYWGGGFAGGWNGLRTIEYDRNNAIICLNQSRYTHLGKTYSNLRRGTSSPFTNATSWRDGKFIGIPTRIYSRVFTGNYLNYQLAKNNWTGEFLYSRMVIARHAAKQALSKIDQDVNIGLMRFDSYGDGGFVDMAISPLADSKDDFADKVNSYFTWGGTPLEETYHEAYLYLTGQTPKYGLSSYSRISGGRPDRSAILDPGFILSDPGGKYELTPSTPASLKDSTTYKQPPVSECTNSSIILFTDGMPQADTASNNSIQTLIKDVNLKESMDRNCSGDGACMDELAYYMANNDMYPDIDGEQTISTHVIAGFMDGTQSTSGKQTVNGFMEDIASAGDGFYTAANDSAKIEEAILRAVNDVESKAATFTSPTVAVNSFNRLESSDEVYFSLFEPSATNDWRGNLKRYTIAGQGIMDVENKDAVDPDTGTFFDSARSFWTPEGYPDGSDVKLGGMANRLKLERKIFTNLSGTSLIRAGQNIDPSRLHAAESSSEYITKLRNWIAGKNADESVRLELEDPLHSQPVIINYGAGKSVAFIGTNSGYLHAFDVNDSTPAELFAFIPGELLHNPDQYMTPRLAGTPKVYGLDGPISYWHNDLNLNGQVDGADSVYLYVAMRRGGHSYYALNVTNPASPKLIWKVHGKYPAGTKNAPLTSVGFDNLGQTWSKLVPAEIIWQGQRRVVLFAGAGYDPKEDGTSLNGPSDRLNHDIGTTIYIIDAETGALLWDAEKHADLEIGHRMTSAFANNLALIDRDSNGFVDMFYASDIGGRIWRFDLNSEHKTQNDFARGGIIADVYSGSGSGNRRFFNAPDISYFSQVNDDFILISIGSGYRAHPLSRSNEDYHFLIKDHDALVSPSEYTTTNFSELQDWGANSDKGWRYKLPRSAEKVLNPSVTYNGTVFFTAYQPVNKFDPDGSALQNACKPDVGSSKLYSLNVKSTLTSPDDIEPPYIATPEIPGIPPVTIPPHKPTVDPENDDGSSPPHGKGADCKKSGTLTMVGLVSIENQKTPRCDVVVREYWKEVANAQN